MAEELTGILKEIMQRDLLKDEIGALVKQKVEFTNNFQQEKNRLLAENTKLSNENSSLNKQIIDTKKEVETLKKQTEILNLHFESERKKINDSWEEFSQKEKNLISREDALYISDAENRKISAELNKKEEMLNAKEIPIDQKISIQKSFEAKNIQLKAELEVLRNQAQEAEEKAKKAGEDAKKEQERNQRILDKLIEEIKRGEIQKIQLQTLINKNQEEQSKVDIIRKEFAEKEKKNAEALENIKNREEQLEIKESIVKKKLSILEAK